MLILGVFFSVLAVVIVGMGFKSSLGQLRGRMLYGGGMDSPQLARGNEENNEAEETKKRNSTNKAANIAAGLVSKVANTGVGKGVRMAAGLGMTAAAPALAAAELGAKAVAKLGGAGMRKISGVAKIGVGKAYKAVTNSKQFKTVQSKVAGVTAGAMLYGNMLGEDVKRKINGARTTVLNSKAYKAVKKGADWAGERVDDAKKVASLASDFVEDKVETAGFYALRTKGEIENTAGYKMGRMGIRTIKGVTSSFGNTFFGPMGLSSLMQRASGSGGSLVIRARKPEDNLESKPENNNNDVNAVADNQNSSNGKVTLSSGSASKYQIMKSITENPDNADLTVSQMKKLRQLKTWEMQQESGQKIQGGLMELAVRMYPQADTEVLHKLVSIANDELMKNEKNNSKIIINKELLRDLNKQSLNQLLTSGNAASTLREFAQKTLANDAIGKQNATTSSHDNLSQVANVSSPRTSQQVAENMSDTRKEELKKKAKENVEASNTTYVVKEEKVTVEKAELSEESIEAMCEMYKDKLVDLSLEENLSSITKEAFRACLGDESSEFISAINENTRKIVSDVMQKEMREQRSKDEAYRNNHPRASNVHQEREAEELYLRQIKQLREAAEKLGDPTVRTPTQNRFHGTVGTAAQLNANNRRRLNNPTHTRARAAV